MAIIVKDSDGKEHTFKEFGAKFFFKYEICRIYIPSDERTLAAFYKPIWVKGD